MDTINAPQLIEHINKSMTYTLYTTKWIPSSARIIVGGITPKSKGIVEVYELNSGNLKLIDSFEESHGIKCSTLGASPMEGGQLAFGDFNGNLTVKSLERTEEPIFAAKAHSSLINCIDGMGGSELGYGPPEIVTGGRDGAVKVWDIRVPDPVLKLEPSAGESARDCWCVAFGNSYNNEERVVCAGYDNGDVKMFDLRSNALLWQTNLKNGITSVEFDRKDIEMNKMVVTTLESKFRVYDLRTQHPTEGFSHLTERAHKSTVWMAKHLPQNRDIFMTAGGNGGLNLYRYKYPSSRLVTQKDGSKKGNMGSVELLNSRIISSQPIVSFDWSPDKEGLCCLTALDQSLRIFIVTKLEKQ